MQPIRPDLMLYSHPIDDMGCPVDVLVSDLPGSISVHDWKDTVVQPLDGRPASGTLLYRDTDGAWKRPDSDVTWPVFWEGRPRTDALLLTAGRFSKGSSGGSTLYHEARYLSPDVLDMLRARPFCFGPVLFVEDGTLFIADDGVLGLFMKQVEYIVRARFEFMDRLIWLDFCWRSFTWRFVLFLNDSFEERSSGRMLIGHYDNVHVAVREQLDNADMVLDVPELVSAEAERLTMQIEDMSHQLGWYRKTCASSDRQSPTTLLGRLCARLVDSDEPGRMSTADYDLWSVGKEIRLKAMKGAIHVGGYWNRSNSNDLESSLEFDSMISTTTPRHFASFDDKDDQAWLDTQYKRAIRHRPRRG